MVNTLLISTCLAHAAQLIFPPLTPLLMRQTGLIRRSPLRQSYRLLSPVFLHASIPHLLTNMYSLRNLGPAAASAFGESSLLPLYLASGVAGNVLSTALSRSAASSGVGASGAVCGLLAAYYVHLRSSRGQYSRAGVEGAMQGIRKTVAVNVLFGLSPGSNIDNAAHLGGFVCGGAAAWLAEGRRQTWSLQDAVANGRRRLEDVTGWDTEGWGGG
ncbi:hypothetical protein TeGR_g1911 [Tetraparma gracilis]|uniref:Peptidase S54 rhomboid domain-containing protein n=1 Tax=Tetraparma gracilis TaxID=2962635 RepID=A0ABQ6MCF2_9STRA|nr:hypothetical protein TeGR_g1911 [Tetraparma gracilis]